MEAIEILKLVIDGGLAAFLAFVLYKLIQMESKKDDQESTKDSAFIDLIRDLSANIQASTLTLNGMGATVEDVKAAAENTNRIVAAVPTVHDWQNEQLKALATAIENMPEAVRKKLADDLDAIKKPLAVVATTVSNVLNQIELVRASMSMEAQTNGNQQPVVDSASLVGHTGPANPDRAADRGNSALRPVESGGGDRPGCTADSGSGESANGRDQSAAVAVSEPIQDQSVP